MKCERIGLRFSRKDEDIISWFLMLKENKIEQSFAVKALLKAFFLNEHINGGMVKIRNDAAIEPTSIAINESSLNDDIMKIKYQGIKLASFTKEIIRSYISVGNDDVIPNYNELQRIHTKYKLKYLNTIFHNDMVEIAVTNDNIEKHINDDRLKFDKSDDHMRSNNIINNITKDRVNESVVYLASSDMNDNVSKNNNDNIDTLKNNKEKEDRKQVKSKKRNPLLAQI